MPDYLYPDLCVIGGGPAGLAVAAAARAHDAGVVVVEREATGGNSLHRGAIPSRALGESARRAHQVRTAAAFGISAGPPAAGLPAVRDHVASILASLYVDVSPSRFEALGARLINAEAAFVDHRTLHAGGALIRARRFVIATGSDPLEPEIAGLESVPWLNEQSILEADDLPRRLILVGGDQRAVELAQALARLGSEVALVDPAPLPGTDPELGDVVLRRLADEGVRIVRGHVASASPGICVTLASGEVIEGSHLLVVRRRRAAIDGLDLDAGGLKRDRSDPDLLAVRGNLTTTNSRVFAIGDAAGGSSASLAQLQARQVVDAVLFGRPIRNRPEAVPATLFTDPELAEVGLGEALARQRLGSKFRVLRASFGENERARIGRRAHGLVKLVVASDDRIIGAGIVGPEAAELISLLAFAIGRKLQVRDLDGFFASYPTLAAIIPALAAEDLQGRRENPVRAAWMALRRVLP